MLINYLDDVKARMGIPAEIDVYDAEISGLLEDCEQDLLASGVTDNVLNSDTHTQQCITAATLYVKAYFGSDRSDSDKYLEMYRNKVFRLMLESEFDDAD